MRLGPRITLAMLAVACVPLGLAGWNAIRLADDALQRRAGDLHGTVAVLLADEMSGQLKTRLRAVRLASAAFRLEDLTEAERLGALRLIYRQVEDTSILVLLDPQAKQVGAPIFFGQWRDPVLADRPAIEPADIERFATHIPFALAAEVGAAVGRPYNSNGGEPRVVVAVRTTGDGVLAVELSLNALLKLIAEPRLGPRGRAFVTDSQGVVVLSADPEAVASKPDRSDWPAVSAALSGSVVPERFDIPGVGAVLGAGARLPDFGWAVIVAEPVEDALAASRALVVRTSIWLLVVLLLGIAVSLALARALSRPIRTLHSGVQALERGDLGHRVAGADRPDELGDLARAFNTMASEIQRWNDELEARVAAKTEELEETQELLIRAQKLAAVGQLGAGLSHEINNPLAGMLGMIQVLLLTNPNEEKRASLLRQAEAEGLRIREIVGNLLRLGETGESPQLSTIRIAGAVDDALGVLARPFAKQGIEVRREVAEDLPLVRADAPRLTEVFLELFTNAKRAMPEGGCLTVTIDHSRGQLVTVRISDNGEGIPPDHLHRIFEPFFTTKTEWSSRGLGLAMVNKVVEGHHGRVAVESELGSGTQIIVTLPAVQARVME